MVISMKEEEYLFDKWHDCPVCYGTFKAKMVRSGKARMIRTDKDLKPVYENFDPIKYDVILCPHCGYAALGKFFKDIKTYQIPIIKEKISSSFTAPAMEGSTYTYEEALWRYKMCMVNNMVRNSKTSEKAYTCLKTGWLLRSMGEALDPEKEGYEGKLAEIQKKEREYLKNALDGLIAAMQTEEYPICGMDEPTYEYLLAVLSMEFGQYDNASRLISGILTSPLANNRTKDKARDLKEELVKKMKQQKAGVS